MNAWLNIGPTSIVPWIHRWESLLDVRVATLWCVGFAMSGWPVVRFRPAVLLSFVASVIAWGSSSVAVLLLASAWPGLHWHAPYGGATTFVVQATAYLLLTTVFSPLLIVLGASIGALPRIDKG